MCEECLKTALEMDPKLLAIVEEVKEEMAALQAKIAPKMRELLHMVVVNVETGEETDNMPEDVKAEINAKQIKIAGIMGMAYATAWSCVRTADDSKEAAMMGNSIMNLTLKGIEEAMAYNYVTNQAKH